MKIVRLAIMVVLILGMYTQVQAAPLGQDDIKRLKSVVGILQEVDHKSLSQAILEVEKSPFPKTSLFIKEATAQTYASLIEEQNVQVQSKKEWLLSVIQLNMAYLQFVGTAHKAKADSELNALIRRKLKKFLPVDIDNQLGFIQSVDL